MSIADNILKIKQNLPPGVALVAVTKTKSQAEIMQAYNTGHRCFGENKAQELAEKQKLLPADMEWHFIGHLQTNKIKYIAPFVSLIHSVDSLKLLTEINKEAIKNKRCIDCLLQFYIATEETKFGLDYNEACSLISGGIQNLKNVRISGVMGMASFTNNRQQIRKEFATLKSFFDSLKSQYFSNEDFFRIISMGMSHDYLIAVEEGSNMVRIGSAVFS